MALKVQKKHGRGGISPYTLPLMSYTIAPESAHFKHKIEVFDTAGYYLIYEQYFEGQGYLLINFHTGDLIELEDYPYIASDKNITAACDYMYGGSFLIELLIKNACTLTTLAFFTKV
jgi:hypothetical protein